jgi:hypothetical protein
MFSALLEFTIAISASIFLSYQVIRIHKRRKIAWELLTAQLQPKSPGPKRLHQFSLDEGEAAAWKRWRGAQGAGLWSMYAHAGVMLEIADFVDKNCAGVDRELLGTLRNDATQIRTCALIELTKYACSQVSERTISNAASAAAYYADMLSKTAQLLEGNSAQLALGLANSAA